MVLAGEGNVRVRAADGTETAIAVSGTPRSYEIARSDAVQAGTLTVEVEPGGAGVLVHVRVSAGDRSRRDEACCGRW